MARQNRRDIFDPNETGGLHAVERTVRWAWLCGSEPVRVRWPGLRRAAVKCPPKALWFRTRQGPVAPFVPSRCVLDAPRAYAIGYNRSPLRGYVRALLCS